MKAMTYHAMNTDTESDDEKQTLEDEFASNLDFEVDWNDHYFTRHNSIDYQFLLRKNYPYQKENLNLCFDDLDMKSHFVINHSRAFPAFIRFLYSGAWIIEAFQIRVPLNEHCCPLSPKSSPFLSKSNSSIWIKSFLERSLLSPDMNLSTDQWNDFIARLHTNEVNSIVNMESFSSFLLQLIHNHSSSRVDSVLLFVIALALQTFCRSELFLHLSEQQWSTQAMLSAPWLDYSRVGRNLILERFSSCEAEPHELETASLLDAMYKRLLLTSNEQSMTSYLTSTCENIFCWLLDLQACINFLPVHISVFEKSSSGTTDTFHLQAGADHPILPSELRSFFSLETIETISCSLQSSTAPISYVTPSGNKKDSFTCASPILRCPLVVTTRNDDTLSVYETETRKYRWNVHRMVFCHTDISCDDRRSNHWDTSYARSNVMIRDDDNVEDIRLRLQLTVQMSFLFSHILA